MLKPLSQKTLDAKYEKLGLPGDKISLLHKYFNCFANLYGCISLREAWDVFKYYEGIAVHRKDFVEFSGIVQRETGHIYSVYELKEVYGGEESTNPLDRLIINNKLISFGYSKFSYLYATIENQEEKPYYLPEKDEFLSFTEERFYLTTYGVNMRKFIEEFISNGKGIDYFKKNEFEITDVDGNSVKGKKLYEFTSLTSFEKFDLEYYKSEAIREKLKREFMVPVSEKILNEIEMHIMTGGLIKDESIYERMKILVKELEQEYGVVLNMKQIETFTSLITDLNNHSNIWQNCGWSPSEMYREFYRGTPKTISAGPNMKKMFASGEMDENEIRTELAKMGIDFVTD